MKKTTKTFLASFFLIFGLVFLFPSQKAEAYGITQTAATKDSITITWEPETSSYRTVLNYHVYSVSKDAEYNTILTELQTLPATQTSTVISNLPAGTSQNIQVTYTYTTSYDTEVQETVLGSSSTLYTLPGKVQNVKQERWYYLILSFDATWNEQSGVDGYEYRVYKSNGKLKTKGTLSGYYSNSISVNQIKNSEIYTVKVRAYKEYNGTTVYGDWSNKAYCFTQPRVTKANVSKNKLTVKWGKVSGATGYDVYVSTSKTKGYKKVKSVGKNTKSVTISKFKGKKFSSKKTYYVYVVTKKKVGKTTYKSGRLYYWNTKEGTDGYGYF